MRQGERDPVHGAFQNNNGRKRCYQSAGRFQYTQRPRYVDKVYERIISYNSQIIYKNIVSLIFPKQYPDSSFILL